MKKKISCLAGAIILVLAVGIFWAVNGRGTGEFPQTMRACEKVCKIRAGAGESYETVGLIAEAEVVTALELVAGENGQTWYRLDKESLPKDMEISADACYIRSDLLSLNE